MKNYTITEEQIKKLSREDQIVEEYLNEWFPEAFKKELEIGKWYISNDATKHIFYVTKITEDRYYYYGFNSGGQWSKNDYYSFNDAGLKNGFRLATEEEISNILIKEAVKRGFYKGIIVNASVFGDNWYKSKKMESSNFTYDESINQLCLGNYAIFKNGVWAEFVKEVTLNYNQIAEKFGIDVEQLRITKL